MTKNTEQQVSGTLTASSRHTTNAPWNTDYGIPIENHRFFT